MSCKCGQPVTAGEPNREARADTKKGGQNRLPRFACHYANRPFFQDI